jgi:hypothetical protein
MYPCPACGAKRSSGDAPCASCGASAAAARAGPALELDLAARPVPPRVRPKPVEPQLPIDLAFDPRSWPADGRSAPTTERLADDTDSPLGAVPRAALLVDDVWSDARLLGNYGEPPKGWLKTGLYAWRVLRRRRELRTALEVRRQEAARAQEDLDDALVALATLVRPLLTEHPDYAEAVDGLRRAEGILEARHRILAADTDADATRLASADADIAKLDAEKDQAQIEERVTATDLAEAQAELTREEGLLKRAESELRGRRRPPDGPSQ